MKNKFRLPHVLTATIIAAIALSIPASALTVDTTLIGWGSVGNVGVHAVVIQTANIYTYSYTVSYAAGETLHIFGVSNDSALDYSNATGSLAYQLGLPVAGSGYFGNPTFDGTYNSIEWLGNASIQLKAGQSRTFSYTSIYAPMDILVYAYAIDGGDGADGVTVGMGAMIPEPSSILALALGLSGFAPFVIRRKK